MKIGDVKVGDEYAAHEYAKEARLIVAEWSKLAKSVTDVIAKDDAERTAAATMTDRLHALLGGKKDDLPHVTASQYGKRIEVHTTLYDDELHKLVSLAERGAQALEER